MTRLLFFLLPVLVACDSGLPEDTVQVDATFQTGAEGWTADYTDFSEGQQESIAFAFEHRAAPTDFVDTDGALYLRGNNRSDDLKMFIRFQVTGLMPATVYEISGQVRVGSSEGVGCAGAGGAPGEAVYLKLGASASRPERVPGTAPGDPDYVLNLDLGSQSTDGEDGLVIGNAAVAEATCLGKTFFPKELSLSRGQLDARTDEDGALWIVFSTDSGYEGLNRLYVDDIRLTLRSAGG